MGNDYNLTYYSGLPVVDNIPTEFREFDRRTAYLTKIQEGRFNLTRLLWEFAKRSGSYVVSDVEHRWGLEYARLARIYMTADSTSSSGTLHDILTVSNEEGRRLQPGDLFNLMGFWVSYNVITGRTIAATSGAGIKTRTNVYSLPEQVKIIENYGDDSASTGNCKIKVRRNIGGAMPTGHADLLVDIAGWTSGTYAGQINTMGPFLWKAGNSVAEGNDDQWTYSSVDTFDYNYTQAVLRKWSATDIEMNVRRFYTNENTYSRNARMALEEFIKEVDMIATFGTRRTETENGKRKWYTGGILEFIPDSNKITYNDSLFQTKNFNTQLKDMFYYGSSTKFGLCGADYYTSFSNMIDNKILLPGAVNGWGVDLTQFRATNGGTLLLAPSDTLSLHGMSDYCIILDPAHFQYGHLQNMDIAARENVTVNPHIKEGEIFGTVTFKRTNPKAHWMFVKG